MKHTDRGLPTRQPVRKTLALNAVFVVVAAAISVPNHAGSPGLPPAASFVLSLILLLLFRIPGALCEWYLTRSAHSLQIYMAHVAAGIVTALIALNYNYGTTASTVAYTVANYVLYSSAILACAAITNFAVSLIRKARNPTRPHRLRYDGQRNRKTIEISQEAGAKAYIRTQPIRRLREDGNPPSPLPYPVAQANQAERPERSNIANRVGLPIGIVTGLASLVQGFDSRDVYKTMAAIAIGGIGLAIVYFPVLVRNGRKTPRLRAR